MDAQTPQLDAAKAAVEAEESGLRFASFAPPGLAVERPGLKGGRRDQNRRAKIEGLCEAALALFLEKGIEGTTIDDITRAAKTAKGSFYRYFEDKRALTETLFAPTYHAMDTAMDGSRVALKNATTDEELNLAYSELAAAIGALIFSASDVVLLYLQEARAPAVGARTPVRDLADLITSRAVELTHAAREQGLLRPFPAAVSARAVIGATENLLFALLREEDIGDPLEIPGALTSLVLDGLRANAAD